MAPQTWHYGLMARWWAEFNFAGQEELAYYRRAVERFGQPALDVACGTGRILVPLLEAGFDVDGVDLSEDMLTLCREQAARKGVQIALYQQAMHELELPRRYRTIYICDSFGIGGRREDDREALRRLHSVLEPGGALVFSHDLPHGDANHWAHWLPDKRHQLPRRWPTSGTRRITANGDEIELRGRLEDLDPVEQRVTMGVRALLWHAGKLVAEEEHSIRISLYFQQEVLMLLGQAGFERVEVEAGYTGGAATADDLTLVFIAYA